MPSEYDELVGLFNARDLQREYFAKKSLAEQCTYELNNSLYTPLKTQSGSRRIDYILAMDNFEWNVSQPISFMQLHCERFVVETQAPGEELSDHWPQVVDLIPKDS